MKYYDMIEDMKACANQFKKIGMEDLYIEKMEDIMQLIIDEVVDDILSFTIRKEDISLHANDHLRHYIDIHKLDIDEEEINIMYSIIIKEVEEWWKYDEN